MREMEERQRHVGPLAEKRAAARERALEISGEIVADDLLQARVETNQPLRIVGFGEASPAAVALPARYPRLRNRSRVSAVSAVAVTAGTRAAELLQARAELLDTAG